MKNWQTYILMLPLFVGLVVLVTVGNASAQSFSAQGPSLSDAQVETNNCRSVALTLFQRINVLEARVQNIIDCHARGELYDTDAADCAPQVSPPHQFSRNGGDVASLAFEDTDGTLAAAAFVGGEPGADIQCEPDPTNPPPAPSDPDDCTAPWGGTVSNGASITAYEQSSVPSGSSCVDETRTCTNGVLSGSFTQQNCTVDSGGGSGGETCNDWNWDFDGPTNGRPMCNNFNLQDVACQGTPNCTVRNVNYIVNRGDRCVVEGDRCVAY